MSGQWVYIRRSEHDEPLFRVGFYAPDGTWQADSDYLESEGAAERCNYLNGGMTLTPLVERLIALIEEMQAVVR